MLYINHISTSNALKKDIKELIPDGMLRRRMSSLVKISVATAMECLQNAGNLTPNAIITATALGFIEDGEKFLRTIFERQEQFLNPTPFIQSTFNTVGAQIALLTNNHCYNMTYCQREESFLHALLDAEIRISQHGAQQVLIGAFDEKTPTLLALLKRLHIKEMQHEGAVFMLVSGKKQANTIAETNTIKLLKHYLKAAPQTSCSALDIPMSL
jgi:3-oxoacyl-(acyl-carrier-protein) synthase